MAKGSGGAGIGSLRNRVSKLNRDTGSRIRVLAGEYRGKPSYRIVGKDSLGSRISTNLNYRLSQSTLTDLFTDLNIQNKYW